jgi:tetratricopeptide (TPR) repeat protein
LCYDILLTSLNEYAIITFKISALQRRTVMPELSQRLVDTPYKYSFADSKQMTFLKDDSPAAYNTQGIDYAKNGEYDLAIANFSKAIALDPNYADAYCNRGIAYDSKSEVELAIKDYTKAIQLEPCCAEAYNNRGITYGENNELDRAIRDFDKAIELKRDYDKAYNNRGAVYRNKGEYDKAIEDCNTVIQLKADYAEPYNNRGAAYRNKGEVDRAIQDYTKAIKLKPDFVEAYYNRGIAYYEKQEFDRAVKDYNKAIRLNPQFPHPYNNRGNVYYQRGKVQLAIKDYDKAIELNPQLATVYYNRGRAWLDLREWEQAKIDLTYAERGGVDIIAAFHDTYKSIAAFEQKNDFKLPQDITAMLTRYPVNSFVTTQRFLTVEGEHRNSPTVLKLLDKFRSSGKPLDAYLHGRSYSRIITGLNEAFIVKRNTRDALIAEDPVSVDILKPFIKGRDIKRWRVDPQDLWLICTHRGIEIDAYPAVKKHLEKYIEVLKKRTGKREWYELQIVPKDTDRFEQPKCVYRDFASETVFAFDDEGYYLGSPAFLLPTQELWLLGVLNTKAVSWFYARTAPQFRGGFLRFSPRYISQIPIPDMVPAQKALIHKLVTYILYLKKQPTTDGSNLANARDYVMVGHFENILSALVYELYLPDELHQGDKHFFAPLLDEQLFPLEEIEVRNGDKMSAFRDIFERLSNRHHPVERNLFFLGSVESIRIIEGRT